MSFSVAHETGSVSVLVLSNTGYVYSEDLSQACASEGTYFMTNTIMFFASANVVSMHFSSTIQQLFVSTNGAYNFQ